MAKKPAPITRICITRPTVINQGEVAVGQVLEIDKDITKNDGRLLLSLGKARPATADDLKPARAKGDK